MTEPIYSYVKGQGWVICSPSITFINNYGITIRLTRRTPEPNEYFYNNQIFSDPGYSPEETLEKMKTSLMNMRPKPVPWIRYMEDPRYMQSPYNIVVEIL